MAMKSVQTAFDVLESIHHQFPEWESSQLGEVKVKLGLLRTFYMCGRKWGKGKSCESTLLSIENTLQEYAQEIQSIDLKLRDDNNRVTSQFLDCIQPSLWQEMEELYCIFSDGSLQTSFFSQEVELVDIIDSLLHNLRDLLQYKKFGSLEAEALGNLEESVRFLKNFFLFATSRRLEHRQVEDLLTHIEGLIVNAAHLTFMHWDYYPQMEVENIYNLIRKIMPVESHVCEIYVGVLQASKLSLGLPLSSHHSTPGSHRLVLGDFVDSLLFLLWVLLCDDKSYLDIFNYQMQKLYGGLTFLRTILREDQNKFDELYNKMHDLIGVVISEAGIVIYYLTLEEHRELVTQLEYRFFDLEEKFNLIEAKEEVQKYPLMLASCFPLTNLPGFIDSVLEKIKSCSRYEAEADSVALAKDKFQTVHDDFVFLRSFLADVMVRCDQNEELKALRSCIATVAYETEFVLDSLVAGDALQSLVVKAEASKTYYSKMQVTKVQNIAKTSSKIPSAGGISVFNELVVGLGDEAQKIIDRLTGGTILLDIVSIVGMSGLGKTTLAKKVYHDPSIICHFHVRLWCYVSQTYNKKSLSLEILRGAVGNLLDMHFLMNEDDLALELYKNLKGKRYLIILDDVWDTTVWNSLGSSFPNDANGSRILLTSRHHKVASLINPDRDPHNLRLLTDVESWELMQKKLSYEQVSHPALLALGMEIAQHCKGLPLMILIVAGILSNTEQNTWKEVAESLRGGAFSSTEQCMKTLELSYSHLPDYLKLCFLYFGAFEEHQQIPVRKLLWLWIAEGFVEKTETECLEQVAEGYMIELIQRSLVMVAREGSRGRVKSCVLHDLLREFCMAKCNEHHFLHYLHGYELGASIEPNIINRLCVDFSREDFAESRLFYPHLSTLFLVADNEERYARRWYDILYKFGQSKLLRVLDLRRIPMGPFFLSIIELLIHLRYMALAIEGIAFTIPSSFDNLSNLETFIVEGSLSLQVSLPDTIWNMKKLRHLCVTGALACWKFPKENPEYCSNLEDLETLSTVQFSCGQEVMRKFPNLHRLKCKLVRARASTGDCNILTLYFMSQLESLSISQIHEEFHDLHFQFPRNLKKLVLSKFCLPWSEISAIDELPNLEVLKLLENAFTGKIWNIEKGKFPKLRFLKLADLDLARWIGLGDNFPNLEKLVLEGCLHLEEVPSCLAWNSTLQIIEVSECESAISSIKQIQKAQMDMGNEELKILIYPVHGQPHGWIEKEL